MVLSASFGAEVFDCESLGFGFERQDVDADGGILFFEERDLFGFHRIIYSTHVECRFVFNILADTLFAVLRLV